MEWREVDSYWQGLLKFKKKKMKNDFTAEEELQMVKMTLDLARSHGLENEVVWSAMKIHSHTDPLDANLNESLGKALQEWDI